MEKYNENNATEQDFVGGGSVTAAYKDALKFAENSIREDMHKALSKEHKMPEMILFDLMNNSKKLDGYVNTIAFVYGKTATDVQKDLMEL